MNKNKLINAYSDLMAHIYEAMDDTLHSFADALDIAKEKISKVSDLSNEDIDRVSRFVKRDVEHAAHGLTEQADKHSLAEWFKFDIELIENFTLDAFLSIADKTRIELSKLQQLAKNILTIAVKSQALAPLFVMPVVKKSRLKPQAKSLIAPLATLTPLSVFDIKTN